MEEIMCQPGSEYGGRLTLSKFQSSVRQEAFSTADTAEHREYTEA
jgi:hypothetical protein